MPLRRSPLLTPAALAARRANALQSTGPRTARGKVWSCLKALRHSRRGRHLRDKIERTGDAEARVLLDRFHTSQMASSSLAGQMRAWRLRREIVCGGLPVRNVLKNLSLEAEGAKRVIGEQKAKAKSAHGQSQEVLWIE